MKPTPAKQTGSLGLPATSIGREDFAYLQVLMRQRTGIALEAGKEYLAETRLAALALREGYGSMAALLESLHTEARSGELHGRVVEALTITETSFFRDLHPFEALKRVILPRRIESSASDQCVNIWSAACSSGQEPFSIAMLIRESFPRLIPGGVRIIASDLAHEVLERARSGTFTQVEVNRGLPAPLLVKYFTQKGHAWQIRDEVRRMVEFRELNLAGQWPALPAMDVIFLRNALLYFDVDVRHAVLKNIARCLRPEGYLVLGGGETTLTLDDSYEPIQCGKTVCYRLTGAALMRLKKAS